MALHFPHINIDNSQILHQDLCTPKISSNRVNLITDALAHHGRLILARAFIQNDETVITLMQDLLPDVLGGSSYEGGGEVLDRRNGCVGWNAWRAIVSHDDGETAGAILARH